MDHTAPGTIALCCACLGFLKSHRRKQDENNKTKRYKSTTSTHASDMIMMLSITAKKNEGIHCISLQRQRHRDSSSHHIHILPQGHCPPPLCTALSSKRWSLYEYSLLCLSALVTHMIYLHNVSIIAMTISSVKKISKDNTNTWQQKHKGYISNNGYLWYAALKIEPGQVSCTVRVVDVREGICVALQRWVGETQRQTKKKRRKRKEGWSTWRSECVLRLLVVSCSWHGAWAL